MQELDATLFRSFNPWDEITTPPTLAALLAQGGVDDADVEATAGEQHELGRSDDFWDIVLGSGLRGTVDAFGGEERDRLRERVVDELRARRITRVQNDVVFARAAKP